MPDSQSLTVDNAKRAKLLLLATMISISLFFLRSWEIINLDSNKDLFVLSAGYFVFTFIGLALAFNFQLNRKSIFLVLPQSSLFVASEVLFIMMFFFRDFERVFDFFFLVLLLLILLLSTYAIFLMANVLNVATFKPIPLLQVATTTSYLASVLMVYFLTFAFATLSVPIYLILGSLFVLYAGVLLFQYYQLCDTFLETIRRILLVAFVAIIALFPALIMGTNHELSALVPASVVFSFIGIEMADRKSQIKVRVLLQYIIVVLAAFLLNILFNSP